MLRVHKVQQDQLVLKVLKDIRVIQVQLVHKVLKVIKDKVVQVVEQVHKVLRELRVLKDKVVQVVEQVHKVLKVIKGNLELTQVKVLKVLLVLKVHREIQDQQARQESHQVLYYYGLVQYLQYQLVGYYVMVLIAPQI